VTNITQTTVTLSWNNGRTQVVNGTNVHYSLAEANPSTSTSIPATDTAHTVTSLQPGTSYRFTVSIDSYGKRVESPFVTATTGSLSL